MAPVQRKKSDTPRDKDGIKPGTCPTCGLVGRHPDPSRCIAALRDRLAKWE